jgi:hypothetical protein
MRPGGFKCCWYEDSNIAGLREAVADAAYAFLTAQLAKRGGDPYLAAPFSRGACCGALVLRSASARPRPVGRLCTSCVPLGHNI